MDAYLSREAYQAFEALSLISPSSNSEGLLIGHKRGHRYFVENVLPSQRSAIHSPQKYFDLNQLFDGKLIGFFSFKPDEKRIKKILAPFAFGKLYLKVYFTSRKGITIKSFIIDYDDKFFLFPIRLKDYKKE